MDKAAIFTDITRRNALRRQAGLPLLDVRAEFDHGVRRAAMAEYRAFCDQHRDDFDRILAEVIALHPPANTQFFRNFLHGMARRRFEAFLLERFGVAKPADPTSRPVIYGVA